MSIVLHRQQSIITKFTQGTGLMLILREQMQFQLLQRVSGQRRHLFQPVRMWARSRLKKQPLLGQLHEARIPKSNTEHQLEVMDRLNQAILHKYLHILSS